jgi:SNF2 family DNA or RNA helicase
MLNLIEEFALIRDYRYVRLDGDDDIEERKKNIRAFNTDPDIFLFLITTRAGGLGLNLTSADTVIIFDSDYVSSSLWTYEVKPLPLLVSGTLQLTDQAG